ncbi:hypothetical protein EXIGLDRAFT_605610 [Exidia glandulosa HHB12029]|uniref:Uncharacterized protein n=1 Tax=Exidia glandulosa HHB12029 TaxID=1314781 RepID=A0A165MLM7_EXIGL|nr:hypothetical protein EXIGLDRAFT_605610 [Exidia glandulosa HHB12029]
MSELVDFDWSSDLTTVRLGNQDTVIRSRGRLVLPYSPVIQSKGPNGNQPRYLFASKELLAAAHLLFERVRAAPTIVIPNVVAVTAFPYPLDGKRCFVCEFDDDDAPVLATQSRLTCVICPDGRAVLKSAPALVEHNSSHILCDTRLKDTHTLCGFCLESGQCRFYLRKRHGTLQVDFTNSVCSKKPKTMSYAPAIQSSPNSPCSNFPVKCSLCSPLDHAIWRYALEHHIRHVHPDEDVEKHKSKWFITKAERDAMKKVFERVENARGPRKPKRDAPALVISDAHSSRLAFR